VGKIKGTNVFLLDYQVVKVLHEVFEHDQWPFSRSSVPYPEQLAFTRRFIATKGNIQQPCDKNHSVADKQKDVITWFGSEVHGEISFWHDDGSPSAFNLEAILLGFSDDADRVKQWVENLEGEVKGNLYEVEDTRRLSIKW
jgi:hypothetical protein